MDQMPDKIEKTVFLRAPLARVWHAISDSEAFGTWFGMEVDGAFVAGKWLKARIRPTQVDPEVAKMQESMSGVEFDIFVEKVDFERMMAFRWLPYPIPEGSDPKDHPMTLATFEIRAQDGGTHLTITESGFDKVPLALRAEAFKGNEGGWEIQTKLIGKYLATHG